MTHGTKPKLLMVFLPHSLFIAAEMGVLRQLAFLGNNTVFLIWRDQ